MEPIDFGPEILSSMDASLEREWLETNGIGGFASSTIVGVNTRRYHGLLVAATKPPVGRIVLLLSKVEETVVMNGKHHDLWSNRYPGRHLSTRIRDADRVRARSVSEIHVSVSATSKSRSASSSSMAKTPSSSSTRLRAAASARWRFVR